MENNRIFNYIEAVKKFEEACERARLDGRPLSDKPGLPSFKEQVPENWLEAVFSLSDEEFESLMERADLIVEEIGQKPYNPEYHTLLKDWINSKVVEMSKFENILAVLKASKNTIVDDHGRCRRLLNAIAISKFTTPAGKVHAVPHVSAAHCLNRLYICEKDGLVHVSRDSVGGVIEYRNSSDLAVEVEIFNRHDVEEEREFLKWGQISELTFL